MNVLITGGDTGQLKWELLRTQPAGINVVGVPGVRLDITDAKAVAATVESTKPDCIINAAAYTAVDKAETDEDKAYLVNQQGVQNICNSAHARGTRVIHVSTDFVFGVGNGSPFHPSAETHPVSVYGASKLAGEHAVLNTMEGDGLVVRTAWVYSSFGQNFVKTMLRLMNQREEIGVVADQVGSPTWAKGLAQALWCAASAMNVGANGSGVRVMHWTGAGVASWYDFAAAVHELGLALGLLHNPVMVKALRTDQFPTAAQRPAYSVMDTASFSDWIGMQPEHWRAELMQMMSELE